MSSTFFQSVSAICGKSNQVMVYGFEHCAYIRVTDALEGEGTPIKQVYNYSVGKRSLFHKTLEGDEIPKINYEIYTGMFKAGITNMVLANLERKKKGKEIIPILFCVDVDGSTCKLETDDITSKTKMFGKTMANQVITHQELRRAYKLCCDEGVDPKVREAAQESFKFVKVKTERGGWDISGLELVDAPWKRADWAKEWAKRKEGAPKSKPVKELDWRLQVNAFARGGAEEMARAVETRKKAIFSAQEAVSALLGAITI